MKINFKTTDDVWLNNGIVAFYIYLGGEQYSDPRLKSLLLNSEQLLIEFKQNIAEKQAETFFVDVIKSFWNSVFVLNHKIKILNAGFKQSNGIIFKNGFVDMGKRLPIGDNEIQMLKKKERPATDNEKRHGLQRAFVRPSYIGTNKNLAKARDDIKKLTEALILQMKNEESDESCFVCGEKVIGSNYFNLNQSINPFYNQHHNIKERGFQGSLSYYKCCSRCYFTNLLSNLESNRPYYKTQEGDTWFSFLLLPEAVDLVKIARLKQTLKIALIDIIDPDVINHNTNIKQPIISERFSSLLSIYHNIANHYITTVGSDDWLNFDEVKELQEYSWYTVKFNTGRNVNVSSIQLIHTTNKIFHLLKDFIVKKRDVEGNLREEKATFVEDIIRRSTMPTEPNFREKFSRTLVLGNLELFYQTLFELYKKRNFMRDGNEIKVSIPINAVIKYINYFMEVMNMPISEELREKIRFLSSSFADVLHRDVTIISKLNNATDENSLANVLVEMMVRVYKYSIKPNEYKDKDKKKKLKLVWLNPYVEGSMTTDPAEVMESVMGSISKDTWENIKNTYLAFICVYAVHKNNVESKKETAQ